MPSKTSAGSRLVPLRVTLVTDDAVRSRYVAAPGSLHVKRIVVVDRNVSSPGFSPLPSVRSRATSYDVTSSNRARSVASSRVRLLGVTCDVPSVAFRGSHPPMREWRAGQTGSRRHGSQDHRNRLLVRPTVSLGVDHLP